MFRPSDPASCELGVGRAVGSSYVGDGNSKLEVITLELDVDVTMSADENVSVGVGKTSGDESESVVKATGGRV